MPTIASTFTPTSTSTSTSVPTTTPTNTPSPTNTVMPSPSPSPRPSVTATPTPVLRYVLNAANLREGPGTEYAVVTVVQPEDPLTFQEFNDAETWYRVRLEDGTEGWVSASMLAPVEE
jgi:SH3-like domain-containing protein